MAEALSVIGLVGSIISIIDAITETYKLAKDAERLPQAFTVVDERIPILRKTFTRIDERYSGSEDEAAIRQTLTTCKSNAEDLRYIFAEVCTVEGDSMLQRYRKALRSLKAGRGDRVEILFRNILDTLLALQAFHVFKTLIPVEDLKIAIQELDGVEPSIAEGINTTIHSSGPGAMFNNGLGEFRVRQQIGDMNGGYQAETINFHTAPALWNVPLTPTYEDPYHDPYLFRQRVNPGVYVSRSRAVAKIEQRLSERSRSRFQGRAVVLYGIGGTGKTQLVLQYVEEHRHEYSVIIWLSSETPDDYVYDCGRMCMALRLHNQYDMRDTHGVFPQRSYNVSDLLHWLALRPPRDRWLVILDNLDDSWGIRDILPDGKAGSVIVTSRSSRFARTLGCNSIHVDSMELDEAKEFLRVAAFPSLQDTSEELDKLCSALSQSLDCHPLAIHLAAAAIGSPPNLGTIDDISLAVACNAVAAYHARLEESKDELFMSPTRLADSPYSQSVLNTFDATLQGLRNDSEEDRHPSRPSPIKLITLLAFLEDNEVIRVHQRFQEAYAGLRKRRDYYEYASLRLATWLAKLLTGERKLASWDLSGSDGSWDSSYYESALLILERWGLIRPMPEQFPKILPLSKIVAWKLNQEDGWGAHQLLKEYTLLVELGNDFVSETSNDSVNALDGLTDIYRKIGALERAEGRARWHMTKHRELFGSQHPGTVRSLSRLVEILRAGGQPAKAEEEIFVFIREARNREEVLRALPSDFLMLLESIFSKKPSFENAQSQARDRLTQHSNRDKRIAHEADVVFSGSRFDTGRGLERNALSPPAMPISPDMHDRELREEVQEQIERRKAELRKAALTQPDLITLFEALSMGSADLIPYFMRYIDEDTVHFRDPFYSRTVLHYLVAHGRPSDVQQCIESGSDIEAQDRYGATPLHLAGIMGRPDVFRVLTAAEANVSAKDHTERTPIQYIKQRLDLLPIGSRSHRDASLRDIVVQDSVGKTDEISHDDRHDPSGHQAYVESDTSSLDGNCHSYRTNSSSDSFDQRSDNHGHMEKNPRDVQHDSYRSGRAEGDFAGSPLYTASSSDSARSASTSHVADNEENGHASQHSLTVHPSPRLEPLPDNHVEEEESHPTTPATVDLSSVHCSTQQQPVPRDTTTSLEHLPQGPPNLTSVENGGVFKGYQGRHDQSPDEELDSIQVINTANPDRQQPGGEQANILKAPGGSSDDRINTIISEELATTNSNLDLPTRRCKKEATTGRWASVGEHATLNTREADIDIVAPLAAKAKRRRRRKDTSGVSAEGEIRIRTGKARTSDDPGLDTKQGYRPKVLTEQPTAGFRRKRRPRKKEDKSVFRKLWTILTGR